MWEFIIWLLTLLSADPKAFDAEQPRAAAAVTAAYATFAAEPPAPPKPKPVDCVCGGTCKDGYWKPDGRILQKCPCPATCKCKSGAACPDGKCGLKPK
jgi:hypothetical protein